MLRECSEVLAASPADRKALYRRGQAHLALRNHAQAASDLRGALARFAAQDACAAQNACTLLGAGFQRLMWRGEG